MKDPIVAEIHRIRERLWAECHGSPDEMAERQRRVQETMGDRLIDIDEWMRLRRAEHPRRKPKP